MDKPTLHEIAAMPFPASVEAMRKFYEPQWGREQLPEGTKFRITADWTIEGHFDDTVEADSAEKAKALVRDWVLDDAYTGTLHVVFRTVELEE